MGCKNLLKKERREIKHYEEWGIRLLTHKLIPHSFLDIDES
jgi:hypothetical protein